MGGFGGVGGVVILVGCCVVVVEAAVMVVFGDKEVDTGWVLPTRLGVFSVDLCAAFGDFWGRRSKRDVRYDR